MVISPFKLAVLLLCALLLGYGAAYIPVLQPSVLQSIHRWTPKAGTPPIQSQIQGVGWVGTRTPYFSETVTFFQDILRLPLTVETPQFAEFTLANGERLGIFAKQSPDAAFMKGPMMEFLVANVEETRSQLEASGVQFIGSTHHNEDSGIDWAEFWGPDGYPYGITSQAQRFKPNISPP